jgi:uncharacterized protein (DUF2267 family)
MTSEELIEEIAARAGLSGAEAGCVLDAVFETLGERLGRPEVEAIADRMPAEAARMLRDTRYDRAFSLDELYRRVAEREGVALGFAVEHTACVCSLVATRLDDATLARLGRALPDKIAALFTARAPTEKPLPSAHGHTLADGRPGSHQPLNEARTRGQRDSVVETNNPHGDTKLSSSSGLTQEREHESIATGTAGSTTPVNRKHS